MAGNPPKGAESSFGLLLALVVVVLLDSLSWGGGGVVLGLGSLNDVNTAWGEDWCKSEEEEVVHILLGS